VFLSWFFVDIGNNENETDPIKLAKYFFSVVMEWALFRIKGRRSIQEKAQTGGSEKYRFMWTITPVRMDGYAIHASNPFRSTIKKTDDK
jgi:hypothetical protein